MESHQLLEQEWAKFNDIDPEGMVACSSGTAALHLALEALQLSRVSQVICPDFTMIACPRAIALAGLTPVFVDCRRDLNIDAGLVDDATDPPGMYGWGGVEASAILAVHIYGKKCDMRQLAITADGLGMSLVEDLAEAHGVRPNISTDAACWSFYRNKIVAGEEGGAVYFKDKKHARRARSLRCLGFTEAHDFYHVPRGMNYRLANSLADLILESLARYSENMEIRWQCHRLYGRECPDEWKMEEPIAPWVYYFMVKGLTREKQDRIIEELRAVGVHARHAFKPMSQQEEFKTCRVVTGKGHEEESEAAKASREVMYLPLDRQTARRAAEVFGIIKGICS